MLARNSSKALYWLSKKDEKSVYIYIQRLSYSLKLFCKDSDQYLPSCMYFVYFSFNILYII